MEGNYLRCCQNKCLDINFTIILISGKYYTITVVAKLRR